MGTENPGRSAFTSRPSSPFTSSPPAATPFSSTNPVVGSRASTFRPTTATPPQAPPRSPFVPAAGSERSSFRPPPQSTYSDPSVPSPPTSYAPPTSGPFQRFSSPQFPGTAQPPSTQAPPLGQPPIQSPTTQLYSQPGSFRPPTHVPSLPMGSPPRTNIMPPVGNMPQASPSYPAARPSGPPHMPGYVTQQSKTVPPVPTLQSPFATAPGGYVPTPPVFSPPLHAHQGGYIPPPPVAAPGALQAQHPGFGPPTGPTHGLLEDFSSLSLGSIPGSLDPGLESKSLPRPLDGDAEPKSFAEMFPMNCHSRFLRLTTSAIPNSQSLVSRWHLPLGAVVCPLAESPDGEEVPIVNFASTGIIRCRRCRTYVNPYVTFTDAGRKWRCNICSLLNEVLGDYFAHLDSTGRRIDLDQRPELTKGSVEYVAPTEYMVRPPMPPLYFFLIDVSISAVRNGMVQVVAQTIKSCLDSLPGFPRTQIGFITFDSTIHFYNLKSSLTQPQMMVVSDLDDIFIPLPDDLLVNLSESREVVGTFLDSLPSMFENNMNVESAFGPALKAAFMVMSQLGGKLLIFQNMLPSLGVGRLKLRGDDVRVYGTDKEHTLRVPEDPFYKQMAADFSKYQIGVNIYAFNEKYGDIASLGTLAKYTGGQVYYYPSFQSDIHREKLRHELARDLTRETAWEAVMRVRCGKGIRFTSYHGNFMLRSTDLLALPAVDCDKAYAMQLSLEDTLLTTQTVYFQVALLYTASCGERRIRVHTAAAPTVTDLGEMYRQADTGAIISLFSRLAIEKTLTHKLEDARNSIQLRIVKALREYRNLYAVQHRLGGRMIYPESLTFLPLYGLALCKSAALRGGYADVPLDERSAAGFTMMALPVKKLLKMLYPDLIRLDEYLIKGSSLDDELKNTIKRLPLTAESLDSRGLYLFNDGFRLIIWFGRMLSPDLSMNLLGKDFAADLSRTQVNFTELNHEMSKRLFALLKKLRETDPSYYQLCHLVRQGEQPREGFLLLANLVEDQMGGTNGYVDWVLQIHRQVQQNA
ncbi:protein transport protein Sec24-like At3g07100 isoform X1 [Rhodamnia argentea]|uniref:Protein transport protein Sec24-like At3g07100 isoform X1 n=1 Tax=Rhodamnia argentea TaxID=178133 RepID=A0A8B8QL28_9MYRT|nr:protein transport protein Sec24-like At3g07100 isoform X1 [Rhodamnia argentea]XP_030547213.2 protein transport protein Sec24-like At3g07100 isoform X1 [Rhodamnia argentea]XP_048141509.1 protein transport protein Sec24-like At3g07100 isoform X1 [Rhodamnia argentea]